MFVFDQRTDKQGCKRCRSHRNGIETYRGGPTILYYIKVINLYKIGVNMSSIKNRFSKEKNNSLIETHPRN